MNPFIAQYVPVADLIAQTFGPDCEVVLHDLTTPQKSVVYTVNSQVTGRQLGQSFDRLVPQVMLSRELENDVVSNYYFRTAQGKLIRSSTALLRNAAGEAVGAICVNLDTTPVTRGLEWLQRLLPGREETAPAPEGPAAGPAHVGDMVTELIDQIIGERDISRLHREEKLELIRLMDRRGVFLMKGAVDQVGARMGISRVTVYSYMDEARRPGPDGCADGKPQKL